MDADPLLEAAHHIGSRLCADALFDTTGQRCNWMGRADIQDRQIARYSVRSAAVGPELYAGSAGIALFLAELYGRTGDEAARLTARAAIRRSVQYLQQYPTGAKPVSFFAGHLGLAYVICRLMDLDPEADLGSQLNWLVDCIRQEAAEPPPLDVVAGCAGAIPPLLLLARRPGLAQLLPVAVQCGEEICRTARWEHDRCHWESARLMGGSGMAAPPVTGLSHGVSGLALALLALFAQTDTKRYCDTARGAFAFEDTFYSEAERNWVDTRHRYSQQDGRVAGTFQRAWCHGAPGIALARMHAAALDPDRAPEYLARAATAIQTTEAAIEQRLQVPGSDATFCHGIAGLSETMLRWGELHDPAYCAKASATALELVRRYDAAGEWPSGVNAGGSNPSFMIGTAGIGYHLLRLRSGGEIPSVLSLLL